MNNMIRLTAIVAAALCALTACTKEPESEPSAKFEQQSLDAWIRIHKPELEVNRQSVNDNSAFYVEVLDEGEALSDEVRPLGESESQWVMLDFDVRTLAGKLCITRNASFAKQESTFTRYTHYVPMYRYCGDSNYGMLEGTYYALRNEMQLGYMNGAAADETYSARIGSKLRLYLPASIAYSSSGASESGGYEGQYSLDSNKPVIVDLVVRDTIANPLQREGVDVDFFAEKNGKLRPIPEAGEDDDKPSAASGNEADGGETGNPETAEDDIYAWRNAVDSIPQVYVARRYAPKADAPSFDYGVEIEGVKHVTPYTSYEPYDDIVELDKKINAALIERFGDPDEHEAGDTIGTGNEVKIWYIARLLDGFIVDTNIDEVKKIIYGEVASEGTAMTYTADESNSSSAISAFYFSIPQLQYGRWSAILTTSSNAYGASGVSGGSTTTSSGNSSYYDYMNYYNYLNYYNYYNNYYGGYYNNYYNNYYGGMYGMYGMYDMYNYYGGYGTGSGSTTTTTTYSSEILPYTPMLFQLYIEAK